MKLRKGRMYPIKCLGCGRLLLAVAVKVGNKLLLDPDICACEELEEAE